MSVPVTRGFQRPMATDQSPSGAEISAARAKWHSSDPTLIAELNKPIPIRGIGLFHINEDNGGVEKEVVSLKIPPGSTLAQIKPIFDARIAALTLQKTEAIKAYRALAATLQTKESEKSDKKDDTDTVGDSPISDTDRKQCVLATQIAHLQLEIGVLNSRFTPALELFAILQKA